MSPGSFSQDAMSYVIDAIAFKDTPYQQRSGDLLYSQVHRKSWHKQIIELKELPDSDHEFTRLLDMAYKELEGIEERHLRSS